MRPQARIDKETKTYRVRVGWRLYASFIASILVAVGVLLLAASDGRWQLAAIAFVPIVGAACLVNWAWTLSLEWSATGVQWRIFGWHRDFPYPTIRCVRPMWRRPRLPPFFGERLTLHDTVGRNFTIYSWMFPQRQRWEWDVWIDTFAPHVRGYFVPGPGEDRPRDRPLVSRH